MNFKDYKEEIIGLANQTFSETYEKIFRELYNNNVHNANLPRNYNFSSIQHGEYHAVIPTILTPDGLQYSNIIIKVLPEITQETAKTEAEKLHKLYLNTVPAKQDSELIVLIALQRHSWTRGFKHINNPKGGYLTSIFVAGDKHITSPNELWRLLMQKVIIPFYEKRLKLYLDSFGLLEKLRAETVTLTNVYYRSSIIIDAIDYSKSLFVKGVSHLLNWFNCKVKWFAEVFKTQMVTRQIEKKALEHCKPLKLKHRIQSKRELIAKLQASLDADVKMSLQLQQNKFLLEKDLVVDEGEQYLQFLANKLNKKPLLLEVACHG